MSRQAGGGGGGVSVRLADWWRRAVLAARQLVRHWERSLKELEEELRLARREKEARYAMIAQYLRED